MVIQLPEWNGWRIEGDDNDWQVQKLHKRKDGNSTWEGKIFFPSIEYAVGFAYEKTLRKSPAKVETVEAMVAECRRVKDDLVKEVRRACKAVG